MSHRKRKRLSRDLQCVLFPDDAASVGHDVRKESASLSSTSSAKSWEKCGDSFLESPQTPKSSGKPLSIIRKLIPSTGQTHEDPVDIAWSDSDSEEGSDYDTREKHQTRADAQQQQQQRLHPRPSTHIQSFTKALFMNVTDKDDLPVIDADSDLNVSEQDDVKDSEQEISECESESFDGEKDSLSKPADEERPEISGYESDGETICNSVTSSRLDSQGFPLRTAEGSRGSVSDWVRSAKAMLQTPQKRLERQFKTPDDSAKKKKKFQSGGLAERLNQLQRRQRSAISFWRHQCISDSSTRTTAVDRPGVLMLEVLEVQKECSMQLALCEYHQPQGEGHQQSSPVPAEAACVLVLFNQETAAQLMPAPRDVIHIHPPWQSLSIEGFSYEVILNTHFSQKVYSDPNPADMTGKPSKIGEIFKLLEMCKINEPGAPSIMPRFGGWGDFAEHSVSLLELIEGLGQAGSVGQDIEVVVQRVFSVPLPNCSAASVLRPRGPSRSSSTLPPLSPAEKDKTRLCVLVQDSCGTCSLVQLQPLPCKDDVLQFCQKWQGRTCVLRGVKVMQRVTREKRSRLFSLIDSLWPPLLPLRDPGNTPSTSTESRAAAPAPSFCYLLSGQETSIEPTEGQSSSKLYIPPRIQTLREILQGEKPGRCSFVATVIYKKLQHQSCGVGQGEVWLVLTDPSLQEEQPEKGCRRTVAMCVSTSCVLTSSVLEALHSPAACHMSFRDAIKEHGVLLCAELSVVELFSAEPDSSLEPTARPEEPPQLLTRLQPKSLPQPVKLDPLSLETTPHSLCTLTGVIVGVDENTAYSWPVCSFCGSDDLQTAAERHQSFYCVSCKTTVDKPDMRIQLEVFLSSSINNCTLKVKLQKKTILSILNTAALEGDEFPGYDVENVLGKEVGPITVYVRIITRKPAPWIGLEEICL